MIFLATTHDQEVFSFHDDGSPCHGFEEVLSCYKRVVANVQLAGIFDMFLFLKESRLDMQNELIKQIFV